MKTSMRLAMVGIALVTATVTSGAPSQKSTYAAKADDCFTASNGNMFFRSGTGVLNGRIEGKLPDGIIYYGYDGVTGEDSPKTYSVNDDGTFTITFNLDYPILDYIMVGDDILYFYASPGDTASVTIDSTGCAHYSDGSHHKRLLELLTNDGPKLRINKKQLMAKALKSDFKEFAAWATTQVDSLSVAADSIAARLHLSAEEAKLLHIFTLVNNCTDCYDYKFIRKSHFNMNTADYAFMRRLLPYSLDCLMFPSRLFFLINRYKHCAPIFYMATGEENSYMNATDSAAMAADKAIFGTDKPSLFLQLAWTDINKYKESYEEEPLKTLEKMSQRTKQMTEPYLIRLLEEQATLLQKPQAATYELPAGSATDIFNTLTARHRGKFVLIDFWSTSCGPCKQAIEHSRALRDSLATLTDLELLFVTNERESPLKAYTDYAAKHLQGEESLRIPNADYRQLMALFKFNGIPHNELVAPDGRIVTADFDLRLFKDVKDFKKWLGKIKTAINAEKAQDE